MKADLTDLRRLKIIHNRARCKVCNSTIESKSVHDFVACPCGAIFVDGGRDYLRRGFRNEEDFEELSETVPDLETQ